MGCTKEKKKAFRITIKNGEIQHVTGHDEDSVFPATYEGQGNPKLINSKNYAGARLTKPFTCPNCGKEYYFIYDYYIWADKDDILYIDKCKFTDENGTAV